MMMLISLGMLLSFPEHSRCDVAHRRVDSFWKIDFETNVVPVPLGETKVLRSERLPPNGDFNN
jgi:hypothetical protein